MRYSGDYDDFDNFDGFSDFDNLDDSDDFGEKIKRTVQEACETGNFAGLSRTVNDTINRAMRSILGKDGRQRPDIRDVHPEPFAKGGHHRGDEGRGYVDISPKYIRTYGQKLKGLFFAVGGFITGGVLLMGAMIAAATLPIVGAALMITATASLLAISLPFFAAGLYGTSLLGKIRRFAEYLSVLGNREYGNIKDFAARVRKSEKKVLKDIEYMLDKRWFLQGHLDAMKTCLMTTDRAYNEYMALMRQREEARQAEAASAEQRAKENAGLPPEVAETLKKGEESIARIRACNEAIPGEEVSEKILRMEVLTRRIFERVKDEPDTVGDIRKLMDYYLPTAVKLLEAYADFDSLPVSGENIEASKRAIEEMLDTINSAFEKLLDKLFRDIAWDISSDVSVLKTMLAQDGLTEKDFEPEKK